MQKLDFYYYKPFQVSAAGKAYFERSFISILIAVVVGLVYGGALWGILPGQRGVSWEGHLFGFLAGAIASWLLAVKR